MSLCDLADSCAAYERDSNMKIHVSALLQTSANVVNISSKAIQPVLSQEGALGACEEE